MKMTFNVLFRLIHEVKRKGKGLTGDGRICIDLIKIISYDNSSTILEKFGIFNNSYNELDKIMERFKKNGNNYPYELINMDEFEKSIGIPDKMAVYLSDMRKFCDKVFEESSHELLVYRILEILRQDIDFDNILYGNNFIHKEQLFGSYAHPKRICLEALLLGLLYYTHKNPMKEKTAGIKLPDFPDRLKFSVIRRKKGMEVPELDIELSLEQTLHENAVRPYAAEEMQSAHRLFSEIPYKFYPVEIYSENEIITKIPLDRNIFLYGSGGIGKTTFMLNLIKNNKSDKVYFYFPLCKYDNLKLSEVMPENCYFPANILLKYFYQYEYLTCESCSAYEGRDEFICKLNKLNQLMKNSFGNQSPHYVLLLDGMNEIPVNLQKTLAKELEYILSEWQNVRVIISGRVVPQYEIFKNFQEAEICGLSENELNVQLKKLHDYEKITKNPQLIELLKNPLFLNLYLESHENKKDINTRGEILDIYVTEFEKKVSHRTDLGCNEEVVQFLIRYALPFVVKNMYNHIAFSYEITRSTLLELVKNSIEFYIENDWYGTAV